VYILTKSVTIDRNEMAYGVMESAEVSDGPRVPSSSVRSVETVWSL
jgi:hypothetical protein